MAIQRNRLSTALLICLLLVSPLFTQATSVDASHFEHEGHCHLISDCDASSAGGHVSPFSQDRMLIPLPTLGAVNVAPGAETVAISITLVVPTQPPIPS